jgi:hypothetical protein
MVVDMLSFELRTDHRGWERVRVWRLAIEGGGATSEAEGEAESSLLESSVWQYENLNFILLEMTDCERETGQKKGKIQTSIIEHTHQCLLFLCAFQRRSFKPQG